MEQIIIEKVDMKIKSLLQNSNSNHFKNSSNNKSAKNHRKSLHDNNVITSDKATSNVAFIYEIFYAVLLLKELGIDKVKTIAAIKILMFQSLSLTLTLSANLYEREN